MDIPQSGCPMTRSVELFCDDDYTEVECLKFCFMNIFLKKSIHHLVQSLLRMLHQASIRWFDTDFPYIKLFIPAQSSCAEVISPKESLYCCNVAILCSEISPYNPCSSTKLPHTVNKVLTNNRRIIVSGTNIKP